MRFGTAPGQQVQMDRGNYRLGSRRVYAFVGVLGYSRHLYYLGYVDSPRAQVLPACHQSIFAELGGVPLGGALRLHEDGAYPGRRLWPRTPPFSRALDAVAAEWGFRPPLGQPARPLVVKRYELGSVILTFNLAFGDWVTVFDGNTALTAPWSTGCATMLMSPPDPGRELSAQTGSPEQAHRWEKGEYHNAATSIAASRILSAGRSVLFFR